MGRRGPPPKPTVLKLVAGNPGKRALNRAEPVPPAGEPEAPDFLDADARAVWDRLVPRLAKIGLARTIDGLALGRYCSLFVLWRRAVDFVRANGSTYPVRGEASGTAPGRILYFREFPQASELRKLHMQLLAVEREFGLTPAARTRINVEAERSAKGDVNELKRKFFASGGASA